MHNLFAGFLGFWMGITSFFHGQGTPLANNSNQAVLHASVSGTPAPSGNPQRRFGRGSGMGGFRSIKGTKLADNKFLSPHAYLIYPVSGDLPGDTQAALSGWKVTTNANSDGSTQVTITPSSAEIEDHTQQFTVQQGEKLYFVELNLKDDVNGEDENRMDDLGILVDANGVIQNDLPTPPAGRGHGMPHPSPEQ